jgi:hypothetical protein
MAENISMIPKGKSDIEPDAFLGNAKKAENIPMSEIETDLFLNNAKKAENIPPALELKMQTH